MQQAKTTPWNNNWFDVYDFTPNKFNTQNYRLAAGLLEKKEKEIRNNIKKKMKELGLTMTDPIIPRVLGKSEQPVSETAVLVAYPVPPPIASHEYELLQSRVHNLCAEELKALSVNLACEGRIKILFVKIFRTALGKWKKSLQNIIGEQT